MSEPRYLTAIPEGLTLYRDAHDFVAEEPGRKSGMNVSGDIGGWDVADGFRLAETTLPGAPDSEWRISVLRRTVYGVLRRFPNEELYTFHGPVWIIDTVPEFIDSSVMSGRTIKMIMWEVEQLRREPDSLLQAVRLIRTTFAILNEADREASRAQR